MTEVVRWFGSPLRRGTRTVAARPFASDLLDPKLPAPPYPFERLKFAERVRWDLQGALVRVLRVDAGRPSVRWSTLSGLNTTRAGSVMALHAS